MAYFSRLTDIVTCNLNHLLAEETDPGAALQGIIGEMQEGLAGAKRSVATATADHKRLTKELAEHRAEIEDWVAQAKEYLQAGNEDQARLALYRKNEVADLVAGLEQQLEAAQATRDHLMTTLRAIEARLADAERRQCELTRSAVVPNETSPFRSCETVNEDDVRSVRVDEELDRLRSELGRESPRQPE